MSQKKEKVFADGFSFKTRDNAPDWVIGRMSVKVDDAIAFLKTHQNNGWVNLNIHVANSGNPYVELDTYVPTPKQAAAPVESVEDQQDLPF